jgi:hypothetical protein
MIKVLTDLGCSRWLCDLGISSARSSIAEGSQRRVSGAVDGKNGL